MDAHREAPEPTTDRRQQLALIESLDQLAELVQRREDLYVRWSAGPDHDRVRTSKDELTGMPLPGLSANSLAVEDWWGDRSVRLWVARRLYDYHHLRGRRDPEARPWVMTAREIGRGPDNETLVECLEPLSWVGDAVVAEAEDAVESVRGDWGPLDRSEPEAGRASP